MSDKAPFDWNRAPRREHDLRAETGVYALFLKQGAALPGIEAPSDGLIYIGKAGGAGGFLQRCHFRGATRNHSPRKSLAVLLMEELSLVPVRIDKPGAPHTWSLNKSSEESLTAWMHSNLDVAIEHSDDPDGRESELVARCSPPLNLAKCRQTEQHRRIAAARKTIWLTLAYDMIASERPEATCFGRNAMAPEPCPIVIADRAVETADEMAGRYGLLAKSFRSALRRQIGWYSKPQIWEFAVGSRKHRDMEEVAIRMTKRSID